MAVLYVTVTWVVRTSDKLTCAPPSPGMKSPKTVSSTSYTPGRSAVKSTNIDGFVSVGVLPAGLPLTLHTNRGGRGFTTALPAELLLPSSVTGTPDVVW